MRSVQQRVFSCAWSGLLCGRPVPPNCGNIPPTTHAAEVLLQWRSEHLLPLGRYDNPLLMARPRFAALVVG
jgi:hypothetical protein